MLPCLCRPPWFSSVESVPDESRSRRRTRWGGRCFMYAARLLQGASPARGHGAAHQISERDTFHCRLFLLRTWVWSCQSLGHFHCDNPPEYGDVLTLCCSEQMFQLSPSSAVEARIEAEEATGLVSPCRLLPAPRGMH